VGIRLSPDGCLVLAGESSFNGNHDAPGAPADAGADGAVEPHIRRGGRGDPPGQPKGPPTNAPVQRHHSRVAVFLGSAVESVEALTIIVAAGVSRAGGPPWRVPPALWGAHRTGGGIRAGPGPPGPHRCTEGRRGTLLLVFGLQWLRKAVLRAVGLKAKHDEDAIFRQHVESLSAGHQAPGRT